LEHKSSLVICNGVVINAASGSLRIQQHDINYLKARWFCERTSALKTDDKTNLKDPSIPIES